jgi:sulfonate transport system permease protein
MNAKSIAVRQPGAAAKAWTGPSLPAASALHALVPWLLPLAVLGLWQLSASQGWLPPQILPAPSLVFSTLIDLVRGGEIGEGLRVSLFRIAVGLLIGTSLGLALGVLIGSSPRLGDYLSPTITALAQIPSLGWVPIFILIFGLDEIVKYLIIAKACFVPTVLATMEGIRGIPAHYLEVGRVLRLRRWTMLTRLVAPAALPTIFGGLRLAISYAWIALIVVEMLAATEGIGYTMVWGRTLFQIDIVIAGMIVVGLIGLLMDFGLTRVERRLRRWDPKAAERVS